MHFATEEKKRLWAVRLLVQRAQELGRTPCKGDLTKPPVPVSKHFSARGQRHCAKPA